MEAYHTDNGFSDLDSYGLQYLVHHGTETGSFPRAVGLLTPDFVALKRRTMRSTGPILKDIDVLAKAAARSGHFAWALALSNLWSIHLKPHNRTLEVLKEILAIRKGEIPCSSSSTVLWEDPNDQLLVLAELAVAQWETTGKSDQDTLNRIVDLSLSNRVVHEESCFGNTGILAENVEFAAVRIALASPETAIKLANMIPAFPSVHRHDQGADPLTATRCLFKCLRRITENDSTLALQLVEEMEDGFPQLFGKLCVGCALVGKGDLRGIQVVKSGLDQVEDQDYHSGLCSIVVRNLLWILPTLSVEKAIPGLQGFLECWDLEICRLMFLSGAEQLVLSNPTLWTAELQTLPDGSAKDLLAVALWNHGFLPSLRGDEIGDAELRELVLADEIGLLAQGDLPGAIALAATLGTRFGYARAISNVSRLLHNDMPQEATRLMEMVIRSHDISSEEDSYLALLEVAKTVVHWPGELRKALLASLLQKSLDRGLLIIRSEARLAVVQLLARSISQQTENQALFWRGLLADLGETESERCDLGCAVLEELPIAICVDLADSLFTFGLSGGAEGQSEDGLVVPSKATTITLLSTIARRVYAVYPEKACDLFMRALEAAMSNDPYGHCLSSAVLEQASSVSPRMGFEIAAQFNLVEQYLETFTPKWFERVNPSESERAERWFRLSVEAYLSDAPGVPQNVVAMSPALIASTSPPPALNSSDTRKSASTIEWELEIAAVLCDMAGRYPSSGFERLWGPAQRVLQVLTLRGWSAVRFLVCNDALKPFLRHFLGSDTVCLPFLESDLPSSVLAEDLLSLSRIQPETEGCPETRTTDFYKALCAEAGVLLPPLFLELVEKTPPAKRLGLFRYRDRTPPTVSWREQELHRFLDLLQEGSDPKEWLPVTVSVICWLTKQFTIPLPISERLVEAALASGDIHVMSSLASRLPDRDRSQAIILLNSAIQIMRTQGILREAPQILADNDFLPSTLTRQILRESAQAAVVQRDPVWLQQVTELQSERFLEDAFEMLSSEDIEGVDLSPSFDSVLAAILREERGLLCSWASRILALPILSPSRRDAALRAIITRLASEGDAPPLELLQAIEALDEWVHACTALAGPPQRRLLEQFDEEFSARLSKEDRPSVRFNALTTIADAWMKHDQEKSFSCLLQSLDDLTVETSSLLFMQSAKKVAEGCLSLPAPISHQLAAALLETTENYDCWDDFLPFGGSLPASLVWCSVAFVPSDFDQALRLHATIAQTGEYDGDPRNWKFSVLVAAIHTATLFLLKSVDTSVITRWCEHLLTVFSHETSTDCCDRISASITGRFVSNDPLMFHDCEAWRQCPESTEQQLLRIVLPWCSAPGQAAVYYSLALAEGGKNVGRAKDSISSALERAKLSYNREENSPFEKILVVYACLHGMPGLREIFPQVQRDTPGILSLVLHLVRDQKELLLDLATALDIADEVYSQLR